MSGISGSAFLGAAALTVLLSGQTAYGFMIDTGLTDTSLRWDNTVKYTAGVRVKGRNPSLLANPNADDGNQNFNAGSMMLNRIDLFSELDASYKKFGVRFSGAGWYDQVYNQKNDNASPGTFNGTGPHDQFPDATQRLHGNNAELLDAFTYGSAEVGSGSVSYRAGQYALQWGETLFFGSNGIAGTMSPIDVVKALSSPNATFKEFIRPTPQVSASWVINPELSVSAYYKLGWRKTILPGVGSYFSIVDLLDAGGEQLLLGPGMTWHRGPDMEPKNSGQYGFQVKYHTPWDLDLGAYAVRFHEMTPQGYSYPASGQYIDIFPEGVEAYGLSASKSIGSFNWAAEVSMRRNMDLTTYGGVVTPGMLADLHDHPQYAVGNTVHANLNWFASLGPHLIANEASFLGEFAWNRLWHVTDNPEMVDPGASQDAWGFRTVYEPMYRQVFHGFDLGIPIGFSYSQGRSSSVSLGPDKGGDMSIGLNGTFLGDWGAALNFTHYYGAPGPIKGNTGVFTYKQTNADRDFVTVSIRHTF